MRSCIASFTFVVLVVCGVWSQSVTETGGAAPAAVEGPAMWVPPVSVGSYTGDPDDQGRREPVGAVSAPLIGGSPVFRSELEQKNYLSVGLGLASTFDDNALSAPSDPKSDTTLGVFPNIALNQSLGRLNWQLSYFGGFSAHQRFSAYNQGSHDLGVEALYKLAEHVDLSVRDRFVVTTGFFDEINPDPYAMTESLLQQPNESVITPLAAQNSNIATVALNDQFSASSAIGGSGTAWRSYYKDVPPGVNLINTSSQEAEGYYNRRISARNSLGVTYRFQRFYFSPVVNDTTTHSLLATYTIHLAPNMGLSVFAGPEFVDTTTQKLGTAVVLPQIQMMAFSVDRQFWKGSGGASYVWNGVHTGLEASVTRTISDGGGLLSAVSLTNTKVDFRREVARRLTLALGWDYGASDAIGAVITPYSSLKIMTSRASITRQLRNNFGLTLGYARVFGSQSGDGGPLPDVNHNRAWVSVFYKFFQPLGR